MLTIAVIAVFLLSASLASGGILLTAALRNLYKAPAFDTLLYYQIFYYTYGFYAIWGQIIVYIFLFSALSEKLLLKTTSILVLIGSPFMLLSWFMIIRFCREVSNRKQRPGIILTFMAGCLVTVSLAGWIISNNNEASLFHIIKYSFVSLNLLFILACMVYLLSIDARKTLMTRKDLRNLALAELLFSILLSALLLLYDTNPYLGMAVILMFFLAGILIPVYVRYVAEISLPTANMPGQMAFEDFCNRFEISNREREIIREICNGLSNQQIADKLFISLQTVKDHTSRIYMKTNCSSRSMLIAMVRPAL
jgi:DNA-binding CsgD family transcriptional regulator